VLAVVGLLPARDLVAVGTARMFAAPVVPVVAPAVGLTDSSSARVGTVATVATGDGAAEANAVGAAEATTRVSEVGTGVGAARDGVADSLVAGPAAVATVGAGDAAAATVLVAGGVLGSAAARVATCVGSAEGAFVGADVFAVSSTVVRDFGVVLDRVSAVLLEVALAALLLAIVATGATVATRVLALAVLGLPLLAVVATGATVATRVLALAVFELLLLTVLLLAETTPGGLLTLVVARGTLRALVAGVEAPAWLPPEADWALGIDHTEPNTTATTTSVDSPAWRPVRRAPVVTMTRCTACMPISPLPTRTDAGVSCAIFGHDLN
jgi:hypothetical protein